LSGVLSKTKPQLAASPQKVAHFSDVGTAGLTLGAVVQGRTPHALISDNGAAFRASLATAAAPLACPWHPQGFEDEAKPRKNMSFAVPPAVRAWVEKVEAATLAKLQANPEAYLKGATADSLKVLFRSALRENHGETLMRVKVSTAGSYPVRCWTPERQPMNLPEDLGGSQLVPLVTARHVWLSNSSVGVLWEVNDLMIVSTRPPAQCPWDF